MTFGQTFALVIFPLLIMLLGNAFWAMFTAQQMKEAQAKWQAERKTLLDRIQAGTLVEYQHLTTSHKPRTRSPMRKAFSQPGDIPDEKEVTFDD